MLENKKEETPIIDSMNEGIFAALATELLPKIQPMIEPLSNKLDKYLGNNEKCIIVRKTGNKASVIIVDNKKSYTLANGNLTMAREKDDKGNLLPPEALLEYFSTEEFIQNLLSGKFTEEEANKIVAKIAGA